MNKHLNIITEYFVRWKIKIFTNKSQLINFNRKYNLKDDNIININGEIISTKKAIKQLRVKLDRKVHFTEHETEITNK